MKCFKFKALCFCILLTAVAWSQAPQRKLPAERSTSAIKIDGVLDDVAWKNAPAAKDFFEWRPNAGAKEEYDSRSEIYILYDNTSIYVAGYLHEKTTDSVSKELAGRDKIGSNDFVGVIFDTYNDKINGSGFYVTPLGEQYDAKYSNTSGEDDTWNAVWYSEAKLQKDGWTFEMRIPYSALRFSSKGKEWGMNITRKRAKSGKQYMWNPVVPTINGFINQEGLWTGISNIKPPVRLSLSPYFSTYLNYYPKPAPGEKKLTQTINGGMDIKYGINQNYTLDMTLIPDFGQVQSDKTVLNLSPFEVKYNENRSFFTEGTELFNKGGLFYSRRVGGRPLNSYKVNGQLNPNEYIAENPSETKLINATKVSGRNQKGLGIGFFNAVTQPMYAIVKDDKDNSRKIETNPLTNYNIIVLDQTLKNNSSVSLINTSVLRSGKDYDANVTAAVFDIYNKKNVYNVYGKIATSRLSGEKNINGYAHNLGFGKTGGRFNFNLNEDLTDDKYNINDMGLLFNNNELSHYLWVGYKWVKPGKWYNNMYLNFNNNLSHRFKDGAYQSYNFNVNINGQLKNLWYAGLFVNRVFSGNDFYEPRMPGRVFKTSSSVGINAWGNSNQAKKYYAEFSYFVAFKEMFNGRSSDYNLSQRYRFNDKLSLTYSLYFSPARNNAGFADIDPLNNVIFSRRKINTVDNSLSGKYNFSKNSGITLIARHYWSEVIAQQFYTLNQDGTLTENNLYNKNVNQNFNIFTIDMVYTWQFAAGSFLNIVWKNATGASNYPVSMGYFKNFSNTIGSTQNNNLSVKFLYYIDYLFLKKKRK